MTHGSLFSGIGGFDLAARWMGWKNIFHCEKEPFCQKVLKYHFPNSESYSDITKTDFTKYEKSIDVLSGGFPCQPFSAAGRRKGTEDDRHLWPEMLRAIREIKPTFVVGENVLGIVNWNNGMVFEQVCADLENEGYAVQAIVLPACAVGAFHRRDRVWFTAYSEANAKNRAIAYTAKKRLQESSSKFRQEYNVFKEASDNLTGGIITQLDKTKRSAGNVPKDNGISEKLDEITFSKWKVETLKAYGNAIVPQLAFEIFKAIQDSII